jgi:hypothetical protein
MDIVNPSQQPVISSSQILVKVYKLIFGKRKHKLTEQKYLHFATDGKFVLWDKFF